MQTKTAIGPRTRSITRRTACRNPSILSCVARIMSRPRSRTVSRLYKDGEQWKPTQNCQGDTFPIGHFLSFYLQNTLMQWSHDFNLFGANSA